MRPILGFLAFVVSCNLLFWAGLQVSPAIQSLHDNGLIIKVEPFAWAFVHGAYATNPRWCDDAQVDNMTGEYNQTCIELRGQVHVTEYNGEDTMTEKFMGELYSDGYRYVWTTACHTGDHPYMSNYSQELIESHKQYTIIKDTGYKHYAEWPAWVDRNENPGKTLPIFVGVGFVRLTV